MSSTGELAHRPKPIRGVPQQLVISPGHEEEELEKRLAAKRKRLFGDVIENIQKTREKRLREARALGCNEPEPLTEP